MFVALFCVGVRGRGPRQHAGCTPHTKSRVEAWSFSRRPDGPPTSPPLEAGPRRRLPCRNPHLWSHFVTPTKGLRHYISNTLKRRLSASPSLQVYAPYVTVGTITCWFKVFFTPSSFRTLLTAHSTLLSSNTLCCTSASIPPTAITSDPR